MNASFAIARFAARLQRRGTVAGMTTITTTTTTLSGVWTRVSS